MARIKLSLPADFSFSTKIQVRITDINYGGHVGNDCLLGIIHEARMQFFKSLGYTELDVAGVGLIMSDVAIEFKAEAFYGNVLQVFVTAMDFGRAGFDLYYKLENEAGGIVAVAKTGMVCFNYQSRKVVAVPEQAIKRMGQR